MRSKGCDISSIPIRGVGFAQDVVAVIPDNDESQIPNRSEHARTRPHDNSYTPSQNAQELGIPLLRPCFCTESGEYCGFDFLVKFIYDALE